jgi:Tfp pilus assembly protein PilO
MLDKTRLEHDIESREILRTPTGVRLFIALLLIVICAIGAYSYNLKQDVRKKDEEIARIKDDFKKETNKLLTKIKKYENQSPDLKSDLSHSN